MLRRATLGAAFLLLATAAVHPALADEGDEPGAEPEGPAEPSSSSAAASAASAASDSPAGDAADGKRARKRRGKSRRHGGKFAGRVVADDDLRDEPLPRPSGHL